MDVLLEILIKCAEDVETGLQDSPGQALTLAAGGILVSGRLISQKLYMQLFVDGAIQDVIDAATASGQLSPPDGGNDNPSDFIHLASAKLWVPGHPPVNCGLWRGRLDAVAGFALGEPQVVQS